MNRSPIRRVSDGRLAAALAAGSTFTRQRTWLSSGTRLERHTAIRRVSRKRARENRERSRLVRELFGPEPVRCAWPRCPDLADDIHEILPRGRGGSITDPSIWAPLCRFHNELATDDTRNQEGREAGLVFHSWEAADARATGLVAAWRTAEGRFITEAAARAGDAA
jgi:hypothetical protein